MGAIDARRAAAFLAGVLVAAAPAAGADAPFRRGDANGDGQVNIGDAIASLSYLFGKGFHPGCLDAVDANDSGEANIADPIYTLAYLFARGPRPPAPGPFDCGFDPPGKSLGCVSSPKCAPASLTDLMRAGHVLNRIAYGPSPADLTHALAIGAGAYVEEQLDPASIDESDNADLLTREASLFTEFQPSRDRRLVAAGELWRYFKGTQEPPAEWKNLSFDATAWLLGPTGIGYGGTDDATVLADMQNSYASVYLRRQFRVDSPAGIANLILRVDYDDGFVAYLNGTEVARKYLAGSPPRFDALASINHNAGTPEEFDLTARKGLVVAGDNVLAIQLHNNLITSGDLSMIPELLSRESLPGPPVRRIKGLDALQQLIQVRGIYSRRQLQAVLAEFWENHFTTDHTKVAAYLDALQNSDASDAMPQTQARSEAADLEHREYQFFHDRALGSFGDLILFSATSPTMLIYLDNVLNGKAEPNENYAREILELHSFGVDNGYVQRDIEELARCFTGWTVCKVERALAQGFPDSALTPPTSCGVLYSDTVVWGLGPGWKFFKGTAEPSPDVGTGDPTTAWTERSFGEAGWLDGSTGIGFGDNDDATILADMKGNYLSVYLRRTFTVADPAAFKNLVLEVAYDDGFVAYLNGFEVARSVSMRNTGSPPRFNRAAGDSHEASLGPQYFGLNRFRDLLVPGPNVLAIQVHNASIDSSDLSLLPRLLDRDILPGSIENGDPSGVWTFRFEADQHDTNLKRLFQETPQALTIPAGRIGAAGLADALDAIDAIVRHPSTAEFICIKLIQRFVSDEITLANYLDGTAPAALTQLLGTAIEAWSSTDPPGNIEVVLRAMLDPAGMSGLFWTDTAYRAKVKTPVEFIASSLRILGAAASGATLPGRTNGMGMHLFDREEPDGWSELGTAWVDTGTMLARISFAQALAENRDAAFGWDTLAYLDDRGLDTADEIVDHFDEVMYQKTLPASTKGLLREYLTTDDDGQPLPLARANADFKARVESFVGLLLSMPHWHFQ